MEIATVVCYWLPLLKILRQLIADQFSEFCYAGGIIGAEWAQARAFETERSEEFGFYLSSRWSVFRSLFVRVFFKRCEEVCETVGAEKHRV